MTALTGRLCETCGLYSTETHRAMQRRHAALIAALRSQAREWASESSPWVHFAEYAPVTRRNGETLTDILDASEQGNP